MKTDHVLTNALSLCGRNALVALGLFLSGGLANAANTVEQNNAIWAALSGNSTTFGLGRNGAMSPLPGAPLSTEPVSLSGWQRAGNFGVNHDADGARFGATVNMRTAAGTVPVTVAARATGPAVAAALGRFMGRALPVLSTGYALFDLARELGFALDNSSGSMVVKKGEPGACYSSVCYQVSRQGVGTAYGSDYQQVCANWQGMWDALGGTHRAVSVNNGACYVDGVGNHEIQPSTPATGYNTPATQQEFEDAVATKSGWPSSSNLSKAIAQAVNAGEGVQTTTATVTGPATSPGTTRTSTASDGKVTTTSTVNNHTYNDNRVTTNVTTTTTIFNPSTGLTTTERVDEAPAEEKPPGECEKNPNTVGCAELDTPSEEVPKSRVTLTYSEDSMFGNGACPADLSTTIQGVGTVKVWDWQQACGYAPVFRTLIITLSLFTAFVIITPGQKAGL